jgi:protocatechuate 3,4-dioxygenase beta subunit
MAEQINEPKPPSVVWNYAQTGLKWGIYVGIGLKCLDTFITLLRSDVMVAILFLVAAGVCFIPKVGIGAAVVTSLVMSRFTTLNLFFVFLGAAAVGTILGALPGMAIGALIGLIKKRSSAVSGWMITKALVLPLVGAVALFSVYFVVVNPWLAQHVLHSEPKSAQVIKVKPTLIPTPTPTVVYGSISGRVVDQNNKPVSGAWISASPFESGFTGGGSAATDASGNYQMKYLASGSYRVSAGSASRVTQYWKNSDNFTSAAPVAVTAPKEKGGINFTLDPAGTISGTVTDTGGVPLSGIVVVAYPAAGGTGMGMTTKENGIFTLGNLPLGSYKVSAELDSRSNSGENYIKQYYNNKLYAAGADLVTLTANSPAADGIHFTLEVGGTISGQVLDENGQPITRAYVWAAVFGKDNSQGTGAYTDSSGNYLIKGVASGTYRVMAYLTGKVTQYWQNAGFSSATPVSINAPEDKTGINFTLKPGGTS